MLTVAAAALLGTGVGAQDTPPRMRVAGSVTVVAQATDAADTRDEAVGSLDLFVDVRMGRIVIHAYIEGGTTPFSGGISSRIPHANADGGTALDGDGTGRVQLSEFRALVPLGRSGELHAGLLDLTGFLDVSRIANDENLYFLGTPFVNNPTIAFPDYVPGVVVEGWMPGLEEIRVALALTGSEGLADHPDASYGRLLDLDARGRGVFTGVRLRWEGARSHASLGGWLDTGDHPALDGTGRAENHHGIFAVGGVDRGAHSVSARIGQADPGVMALPGFLGATWLWAPGEEALGLAVGRSSPSDRLARTDGLVHTEGFIRRRFFGGVFLTASVQRIELPRPADGGTEGLWVAGVRLSAGF